ncbi:hypothetical protein KIPB_007778 [Kipferlia bialata]|uniref:Uncharacterized protein n=1 Tax=Kipferlia bialata TaxID=797122 RepID=A0A9K3GKY8_9EUKA|nr:hypothetical protein KIPB_007778 [Kipferlia bialata]|eukprot:g7778.t1
MWCLSANSLPVFHHPPLSHFTEHTVGYEHTRRSHGSTRTFYSNVFYHLQSAGFNPTLYGSYGTVYATETSDMDIAIGRGSLYKAMISLESAGVVGACVIIGSPGERNRRHMKVYAPCVGQTGDHIDIVLYRDNDGPQKKQILLNLATVLPVMPHLKSVLKTMASATGCLAPGTRAQKDHERNGTQLIDNAIWAIGTVHTWLNPLNLGGHLPRKTREYLLTRVQMTYDTSSPEALLGGVLMDWCAYNRVSASRSIVCQSVVNGSFLLSTEGCYLPDDMQALVEPMCLGLESCEPVPALEKVLAKDNAHDLPEQTATDTQEPCTALGMPEYSAPVPMPTEWEVQQAKADVRRQVGAVQRSIHSVSSTDPSSTLCGERDIREWLLVQTHKDKISKLHAQGALTQSLSTSSGENDSLTESHRPSPVSNRPRSPVASSSHTRERGHRVDRTRSEQRRQVRIGRARERDVTLYREAAAKAQRRVDAIQRYIDTAEYSLDASVGLMAEKRRLQGLQQRAEGKYTHLSSQLRSSQQRAARAPPSRSLAPTPFGRVHQSRSMGSKGTAASGHGQQRQVVSENHTN